MSYGAERSLAYLYPLVIASSIICCVTSGTSWSHWRYVLNACPETNCGCYLHARSTYTSFEGGHIAYCHYATYGLILPLLFCTVLGIYHVYRVCLGTGKRKSGTTTIRQRWVLETLLHSTFYIGRSSYNFLKNDQLELLNRKEKLKLCGTYSMRMLVQLYFVGTFWI